MVDDRNRELGAVLSYLVGRHLRPGEIVDALGISRSAYYVARDEGRLVTADNLLRLAASLDLNPIDLMLRYGLVNADAVLECAKDLEPAPPVRKRLKPRPEVPPL